MMRSLALIAVLTLIPLAAAARDPRVGQVVFLRPGAEAKKDGVVVDIHTIPGSPPGPHVEKIDGDWLWLQTAWVHKKDVMNPREAVEYYTEQVRLNPKNAALWRILGTAWGNADTAEDDAHQLKCFTEAIQLDPRDANTYFARGVLLAYQSQHGEAVNDFSAAIRLQPNVAKFYNRRGMTRRWLGEIEEQISDYSEAIRLDPTDLSYLHNRAYTSRKIGDIEHFLEDYGEIIRRAEANTSGDNSWYSFALKGIAFARASWPDDRFRNGKQAVEYATKACELSAKSRGQAECSDEDYLVTLAAAYAEAGDFTSALKWGKKALKSAHEDAPEFLRDEQVSSADAQLKLYQAKKPFRDARAYNDIAWLKATCSLDRYRDGKKALELATQACELTQWKNWRFLDTLSAAFAETGDFVKAVQWQQKAIEMAPQENKEELESLRERLKLYQANQPCRKLQPI